MLGEYGNRGDGPRVDVFGDEEALTCWIHRWQARGWTSHSSVKINGMQKIPIVAKVVSKCHKSFFLCKREQKGTIISDHMLHIVLQVLQACLYNVDVGCPGHICWKR